MAVVTLNGVGVQGVRIKRRRRRFKRIPSVVGTQQRRLYWEFRHVTASIEPGECVFLIDPTATRASTLMRMMCGLLPPDEGVVEPPRRGLMLTPPKRNWVSSVSVGQAIRLLAGLYGMTDAEIDERFDECVEFSGITRQLSKPSEEVPIDAIRQIAFAVGTRTPVDLLGLDGMAIAGSPEFRPKCVPRLRELLDNGTALVIISSDDQLMQSLGNRSLLVEKSGVRELPVSEALQVARDSAARRRNARRRRRRAAREEEDDGLDM